MTTDHWPLSCLLFTELCRWYRDSRQCWALWAVQAAVEEVVHWQIPRSSQYHRNRCCRCSDKNGTRLSEFRVDARFLIYCGNYSDFFESARHCGNNFRVAVVWAFSYIRHDAYFHFFTICTICLATLPSLLPYPPATLPSLLPYPVSLLPYPVCSPACYSACYPTHSAPYPPAPLPSLLPYPASTLRAFSRDVQNNVE